jgi:hypothetical protein
MQAARCSRRITSRRSSNRLLIVPAITIVLFVLAKIRQIFESSKLFQEKDAFFVLF